jgi:hypothetical protein
VLLGHHVELLDQLALVGDEAVVQVVAVVHVHAGFPVVHLAGLQDARDEVVHSDLEVEHLIRRDGEAEQIVQPRLVRAPRNAARDRGVDVRSARTMKPLLSAGMIWYSIRSARSVGVHQAIRQRCSEWPAWRR